MTCQACANAVRHPRSDEFRSGCGSCDARALAMTRVDLLGKKRAQEAIAKVFKDNAEQGEQLVRQWLEKIKQRNA